MAKIKKSPKTGAGLSLPFDMIVYQATSEIFVGERAKARKLAAVKQYITKHVGDKGLLVKLVAQYGAATVHPSILRLLSNGVYESDSKACQCFPDLFEPPTTHGEVGTALKDEAATMTEHTALVDMIQAQGTEFQANPEFTEATIAPGGINDGIVENGVDSSSALPVYLPFPAEHMLMEKLQKALELACYQFGLRALPDVMQKQGWDCPESVELSEWVKLVGRHEDVVWEGSSKPTESVWQSITAIRHTAVHRLRTNSTGLEQFLADAERLAWVLGNSTFAEAISQLRVDTQNTLMELIENRQSIQMKLEEAREELAKQRAVLDQKEQEVLQGVATQERKHCHLAGQRLERALHHLGDFRATSDDQGALSESVDAIEDDPLADDNSDFDDEERFEDCKEE